MTTTTVPGRALVELIDRHPLRRRILEVIPRLEEARAGQADYYGASPVELARDTGIRLGTIAYHVRVLTEAGALKLVAERRVRGAVEHRYRVTEAGRGALDDTPLAIAIAALERIAEGHDDDYPREVDDVILIAEDALARIRR